MFITVLPIALVGFTDGGLDGLVDTIGINFVAVFVPPNPLAPRDNVAVVVDGAVGVKAVVVIVEEVEACLEPRLRRISRGIPRGIRVVGLQVVAFVCFGIGSGVVHIHPNFFGGGLNNGRLAIVGVSAVPVERFLVLAGIIRGGLLAVGRHPGVDVVVEQRFSIHEFNHGGALHLGALAQVQPVIPKRAVGAESLASFGMIAHCLHLPDGRAQIRAKPIRRRVRAEHIQIRLQTVACQGGKFTIDGQKNIPLGGQVDKPSELIGTLLVKQRGHPGNLGQGRRAFQLFGKPICRHSPSVRLAGRRKRSVGAKAGARQHGCAHQQRQQSWRKTPFSGLWVGVAFHCSYPPVGVSAHTLFFRFKTAFIGRGRSSQSNSARQGIVSSADQHPRRGCRLVPARPSMFPRAPLRACRPRDLRLYRLRVRLWCRFASCPLEIYTDIPLV